MTEQMHLEQYVVGMVATNCYLVENTLTKESLIIDPGAEAERLQQAIGERKQKPVAILLTHGHFDHAAAAGELAKQYQIPVYAHEAERRTLETPALNLSQGMGGSADSYHADVFLSDEQELDLAGFHIRVLFTPGHTPGGCCYYIPREDVVFSGDSLFCGSIGRTDFPEGSARRLIDGVRSKLMVLPEQTLVLPGHDSRTTIEQERMYNPFL